MLYAGSDLSRQRLDVHLLRFVDELDAEIDACARFRLHLDGVARQSTAPTTLGRTLGTTLPGVLVANGSRAAGG